MILSLPSLPPSVNQARSDEEIISAYQRLGSVHRAGAELGITHSVVHRRLQRAGVKLKGANFSAQEKERVREYYRVTPAVAFDLDALSAQLGRQKTSVCRIANALGLTMQERPFSEAHKQAVGAAAQGKWSRQPHPRGFLGKRHTDETLLLVSKASKRSWATQKTFGIGNMSPANLQTMSDRQMLNVRLTQSSGAAYSRARSGRRDDLGGQFFRSSWEANYARYLNWLQKHGAIERWEYEPETFWFLEIKRGVRSYLPDFKVYEAGRSYFVEVKGWMDAKSKTKLARMAKYYPAIEVQLVGAKQYRAIANKVCRLVPHWETAKGEPGFVPKARAA